MYRSVFGALLATAILATPTLAQQTDGVTVEAAVGRSIVDRMPADTASAFPADVGQLACWTRVTGAAGSTITHVWIHADHEYPVELQIGGSPWRTHSTKVIPAEWTGDWRIEIRDAQGNVLKTLSFTVGS